MQRQPGRIGARRSGQLDGLVGLRRHLRGRRAAASAASTDRQRRSSPTRRAASRRPWRRRARDATGAAPARRRHAACTSPSRDEDERAAVRRPARRRRRAASATLKFWRRAAERPEAQPGCARRCRASTYASALAVRRPGRRVRSRRHERKSQIAAGAAAARRRAVKAQSTIRTRRRPRTSRGPARRGRPCRRRDALARGRGPGRRPTRRKPIVCRPPTTPGRASRSPGAGVVSDVDRAGGDVEHVDLAWYANARPVRCRPGDHAGSRDRRRCRRRVQRAQAGAVGVDGHDPVLSGPRRAAVRASARGQGRAAP